MKQTILCLAVLWLASIIRAQKKAPVQYEFPAAMSEAVKAEYIKMWEKGQVLYEINCAACHNLLQKRKTIIPDFSPAQLQGYELRVSNAQHETNMPDEKVTAEELILISTFLTYKQKSGVDAVKH